MKSNSANLAEVFSSIQGEGIHIGRRQVFIRFIGCNLACAYCDTHLLDAAEPCRLESTPGRGDFFTLANPVPLQQLIDLLARWQRGWPGVHHSISLTGGEPLLHVNLLQKLIGMLRSILPVHLETNGVLYSALATVVRDIDFISMDIKLPSTTGEETMWDHHAEFLSVAAATGLSVKIVVSSSTQHWEVVRAAEMTAAVSPSIPFIIQPETAEDLSVRISSTGLIELQELAAGILRDVRIIPQTHRFIGLL
ncbi:MAG TPA: 7-carboxy-7-deazaguanine synthase QueE [Geobacteraceae bacterium]|nr:7-carboxy-7-deazaguanine synthase QueE [Geobacteraceae bacterium]